MGRKGGRKPAKPRPSPKKNDATPIFFGAVHSFLHFSGTRGAPRGPKRPNLARTAKAKENKARNTPEETRAHQGEAQNQRKTGKAAKTANCIGAKIAKMAVLDRQK